MKMYAIVEIAGQQFKVEEGKKIFVHRLEVEDGTQVDFDKVLLIEDEGKITIGEPTIKDAVIEGKVLDHLRGEKVIVFKKKRKKGFRTKNGHRQNFTQVEIVSINKKGSSKKETPKKEEATVAETKAPEAPARKEKAPAKKTPAKKEKTVAAEPSEKKVAEKKSTVKKVPAKKAPAKKPSAGKAGKKKE
jgi:large subunit ribosomal protein L21